jgi:RHS repeat-associated protein
VQEYTGTISTTSLAVQYVRGSDWGGGVGGLLYSLRGGTPSFKHYNARGDILAESNATGASTWRAQYDAYGTRAQESGTPSADRQRGNTKDEDPSGLRNDGFRYYDLDAQIYVTADPAGFVDGPNLYCYVVQNPWSKFDPEGLEWDSNTMTKDGEKKKYADLEKTHQSKIKVGQKQYDQDVAQYNDSLKKLRETPFGSAMHERITNDKRNTYYVTLGASQPGEAAHYNRRERRFSFNAGEADLHNVAHEFMHAVQHTVADKLGRAEDMRKAGEPFKHVYSSRDYDRKSNVVPHEAEAQRAANIVVNEYNVISALSTAKNGFGNVVPHPLWNPKLQDVQNKGKYRYGDPNKNGFVLEELTGTYLFEKVLEEANNR